MTGSNLYIYPTMTIGQALFYIICAIVYLTTSIHNFVALCICCNEKHLTARISQKYTQNVREIILCVSHFVSMTSLVARRHEYLGILHCLSNLSFLYVSFQMVMDVINDITELKRFHAETEEWIGKALTSLGWSRENLRKVQAYSRTTYPFQGFI